MRNYLNVPVRLRETKGCYALMVFLPFEQIDEYRYQCRVYLDLERYRKGDVDAVTSLDSRLFQSIGSDMDWRDSIVSETND